MKNNDKSKVFKAMKKNSIKKREIIFLVAVFVIPCFNFLFLNIGNIINTGYLAFVGYGNETYFWNNLQNFKDCFNDILFNPLILTGFKNSVLFFCIHWVQLFVSLLISFYIYKEYCFGKFFRVLFVMPGIIASMVWVRLFKYFVELAVPELFGLEYGLLTTLETILPTLIFYGVWMNFAGNMIIFVGSMSGVSNDVVEAGQIDGISIFGEFWHIVIPQIWPVLSISFISAPNLLINSGAPLFDFYNVNAHESLYSISYFLQVKVLSRGTTNADYAYSAAFAWITTIAIAPLTFLVRWVCERFGPRED